MSCLLLGLAGIGKTQIAVEFCYRYAEEYDWQFFVAAGNHDELFETFTRIADRIPRSARVSEDAVSNVLDWLETTSIHKCSLPPSLRNCAQLTRLASGDSWLIVFDDVEDWPSINTSYLPRQCSARSAVMLTSQLTAHASNVDHVFRVESLPVSEGAQLIERHVYGVLCPTLEEHDAATRISKRFSGFPAFLAHIGGIIAESVSSIERYDKVFNVRHSVGWKVQTHATIQYRKPIHSLWESAMNDNQMSPSARRTVMVMSFLDPDAIPESFLLGFLKTDSMSRGHEHGSEEARYALALVAKACLGLG